MSDQPHSRTEIDDILATAGVIVGEGEDGTGLEPPPSDELAADADATPPAPRKPRKSAVASIVEWIVVVAVAVTAALLVKAYVVQQFQVAGDSMMTTLHNGDRVLVNKLSYRMHDPNRGDVVVLKTLEGAGDERDLIKRVIALPGETVDVRGNCEVVIDGRVLQEPYLDPAEAKCGESSGSAISYPFTVPEDHVFVLGDNRDASKDSRELGAIAYEDLLGRAFVVIWPTSDWQWL